MKIFIHYVISAATRFLLPKLLLFTSFLIHFFFQLFWRSVDLVDFSAHLFIRRYNRYKYWQLVFDRKFQHYRQLCISEFCYCFCYFFFRATFLHNHSDLHSCSAQLLHFYQKKKRQNKRANEKILPFCQIRLSSNGLFTDYPYITQFYLYMNMHS